MRFPLRQGVFEVEPLGCNGFQHIDQTFNLL